MVAFIINYNRLFLPKKIADYLVECNIEPIIVDNNSTYQPLLDFYSETTYKIIKMNGNFGHNVIWDHNILNQFDTTDGYIVTDSDLDISHIPKDFLDVFNEGLKKYPQYQKCGFSLRINDLPFNQMSKYVYDTEIGYWRKPLDGVYFDASIDTTFALYKTNQKIFKALRTNEPYSAKHIPWYYNNISELPEDEKFYLNSIQTSTYYSHILKNSLK